LYRRALALMVSMMAALNDELAAFDDYTAALTAIKRR